MENRSMLCVTTAHIIRSTPSLSCPRTPRTHLVLHPPWPTPNRSLRQKRSSTSPNLPSHRQHPPQNQTFPRRQSPPLTHPPHNQRIPTSRSPHIHALPQQHQRQLLPGILFQPAIDTIYFRSENQPFINDILRSSPQPAFQISNIRSLAIDDCESIRLTPPLRSSFVPYLYKPDSPLLLRSLKRLFIMRVGPMSPWTVAEEREDAESWEVMIANRLEDAKSPLRGVEVRVVRKSRLWDGVSETGWEGRPHWMARGVREELERNELRRREVLGERAGVMLYSRE